MQTNQPDILTDKKERNDFYIALATIFLTGVFITQTSLISPDKAVSREAISTSDVTKETDDHTSTYLIEQKDIEEPDESSVAPIRKIAPAALPTYRTNKIAPVDKAHISSVVATKTQEVKDKIIDITEVKEEAEEVITEVKEDGAEMVEEIKSETKNTMEEVREEIKEMIEEETTVVKEEIKSVPQETKAVLSSALDKKDLNKKDCIIAIGLYEEPKNVSKLSYRLESEGYDVFTKNLRRLTQVGVYISCDPTMSKSVLSEIQEIYAKDAFIVER